MKQIIFIALAISLQTSVVIHLYSLIAYLLKKKLQHFRYFMITAVINIFMSIGIAIIVIIDQKVTSGFNLDLIFLLESGMLFIYMVAIKVRVTMSIILRLRDPENYHFSHFGKKIYHTTIVNFQELMTYFLTLPFTMMAGAYFIVKIMKY